MQPEAETTSPEHKTWLARILVSTYVGYAGFYLTRNIFSVCKTSIAEFLRVDLQQVAHIWTAYLVAYFVGQFLVSALGRRTSARFLLLVGLATSIAVNLLYGASNSYPTFMVLMFVNGLAQAMGWPGCVGAVAEWLLPRYRALTMGVWSTNLVVGNMLVKVAAGWLLGHWGWRHAYFGCAMITLGTWFLLLLWQRDKPEDVGLQPLVRHGLGKGKAISASNDRHLPFSQYLRLASHPIVLMMAAGYFSIKFLRYAADSWLPTFLELHGMGRSQAAYYSTIYDLCGLPGMMLAGWALTRWFRGSWSILCLGLGLGLVVGYAALTSIGPNPVQIALCFGFIGLVLYGADSLLKGLASLEVAGERNGVAVAAFINGVASIAPVLQEEIIGAWMKTKDLHLGIQRSHTLALSFAIVFVITMTLIVWRLRWSRGATGISRPGLEA